MIIIVSFSSWGFVGAAVDIHNTATESYALAMKVEFLFLATGGVY
jgi:hypothetical protein